MKPLVYMAGLVIAALTFFFTYTSSGFQSKAAFYAAATACSYVLFSTMALIVTRAGKKKSRQAWAFFGGGIVVLFAYLPSLRFVVNLFYLPRGSGDTAVDEQLYFYAPMIVSALCIYRGISLWGEESLERKTPNQTPEPTAPSGRGSS